MVNCPKYVFQYNCVISSETLCFFLFLQNLLDLLFDQISYEYLCNMARQRIFSGIWPRIVRRISDKILGAISEEVPECISGGIPGECISGGIPGSILKDFYALQKLHHDYSSYCYDFFFVFSPKFERTSWASQGFTWRPRCQKLYNKKHSYTMHILIIFKPISYKKTNPVRVNHKCLKKIVAPHFQNK